MREKLFSIICAFSLLLNSVFPVLSVSAVYAQETTSTTEASPSPSPSETPTPEPSPSVTPTESPTPEPSVSPSVTPSATPEVLPVATESAAPTTQPENTPSSSPIENNNQANAPPSDSPLPSVTPSAEVSPSPSPEPVHGQISASIIKNSAGTPKLDLNPTNVSSASLTTNKNDYSPAETVIISGTNFAPKTDYTLVITSSDAPAVNFETKITTDENGSFIYSYQLDGTYRPNYKVAVKDASGGVVASTTFTDSPASGCTSDSGGLNDLPGAHQQKDLTKMCVNYAGLPTSINFSWNWDNASFTGGNTGDACALFDTDSDGNANYAVCVQVGGDPGAYITKYVYSCNDSSATNCLGSVPISPSAGTTCSASINSDDPFAGGADYPNDTVANCTVTLSDVGGSLATLTDVCSYPSASTPSNASDCILFKANAGKLTVTKVLSPNTDPGLFNLQVDGTTQAANVGNGGTTLTQEVSSTVTHTVGETEGTSTSLSNYTSSVICKDGHGTGNTVSTSGTNPWTLSVADGTDVLCTITNTRVNNASITIVKDAQPDDAQDFAFTTTGSGLSSFSLDDDSDPTLSNTKVFSSLAAGTYSVSEGGVTGWTSDGGVCSDGSPVSAISLQAGENVTCTFINTRDTGTIELKKVWSGTAGQTTLNIGTSAGGTQTASQLTGTAGAVPLTTGTQTVSTGTYFVSETGGLTDYNSSLACTDDGSPVTPGTNNSLSVTTGHAVICTFTNTLKPTYLTLVKTVTNDNSGSAAATAWTLSASGPTPISGATGASAVTNAVVGAGAYTLSESGGPTGYTAGIYSCVKNTDAPVVSNSITLAPGDSATCTINNDDNAPALHLRKTVTNDNGGSALNTAWTLTATGTVGSPTNLSGTTPVDSGSNFKADTYTLSETGGPSGYTASQYSCVKNSSAPVIGNSITLGVGDTATCTITNDDVQPKLTVTKVVVNDNGGIKEILDFPLFVNATSVTSGVQNGFNVGTYTVSETNPGGYTGIITGDCASNGNITLSAGDVKSCTITNNDQPAHVIVIKNVTNNDNGTKTPSDFTMRINGTSVGVGVSFPGVTGLGTNTTVNAGNYIVSEDSVAGYSGNMSGDCLGSIANGETKTCTVTNDDQPANLIVIKHVVNDNGGTAAASTFTMHINGTSVGIGVSFPGAESPGINTTVKAGSFAVTEDSVSGYSSSTSGDCSGTVANGETKTCTIINNDTAPTLKLVKLVTNDNGGTATPSAWTLTAGGEEGFSDAGNSTTFHTVKANIVYTLSESVVAGYDAGSWSCDGGSLNGSTVTLGLNQNVTCTITNNDQAAHLIIIKAVVNDNGGTKGVGDFSGTITGVTVSGGQSWTGTVSPGVDKTLTSVGSYGVSETADPDYDTTYSTDCTGTIALGQTKTCTVTNNDKAAHLIVIKHVVNDNGGDADASDFTMTINGVSASGGNSFAGAESPGVDKTLTTIGSYNISETGPSGYASGSSSDCSGTISLGQIKTCTITNNDIAPQLTVIKHVIDDNGGTAVAGDFTMNITGTNVQPSASFAGSEIGTTVTLDQGSYSVDENVFAGYAKAIGDNCSGTINVGESKTCTITNNDADGTLIVKKVVINDNGGILNKQDFSFQVGTDSAVPFEADGQNDLTVDAGTYTVTEPAALGYDTTYDNCTRIVIPNGGTQTCTITNNDQPAHLKVIKHVDNNSGGTAQASDFTMTINGVVVQGGSSSFSGEDAPGTDSIVEPGTYNVTEEGPSGYSGSFSTDCSGTIALGQTKTCTVTNNDQAATLIVKKIVINDNGGTKLSQEFSFEVNEGSAVAFEADGQNDLTVDAGTYSVTEPQVSGYDTSYDNCSSQVIPNGGTATCTITNDDIQPKLTVTKVVVNDNGGQAQVSDFPLFVNSTQVTSGVQNGFNAGSYTVSETSQSGYSETISGDCTSNGNITLALGDVKSCTITNDDESGTLIVRKVVVNDDGGTQRENDFSFSVNGASAAAFEADGQNDLTVNAGTYNITEPEVTGYATSYDNCADVNIPNGGSATCIITNDDIAPILTLAKTVTNDNGGLATQDDFNVYINSELSSWGEHTLSAGNYTVSEDTISGYTPTSWGTDCAANGTITLNIGDEKTCSITNDDEPGKISGKKFNDLNGDYTQDEEELGIEDWKITLDKENDIEPPVCIGGTQIGKLCVKSTNSSGNYAFTGLTPGTYIVAEQQQSGWLQTRPGFFNEFLYGDQGAQSNGTYILTIGSGDEITGRDFGNQGRGTITVHKNADGNGDGDLEDEVDTINATNWVWDIGGDGFATGDQSQPVAAGDYTISEHHKDYYHVTGVTCNNDEEYDTSESIRVSVEPGQNLVCTFTNTRDTGIITILKNIDNNGDGDTDDEVDVRGAENWTWDIQDGEQDIATGQSRALPTGDYTVSEDENASYKLLGWTCSNEQTGTTNSIEVNVANGPETTCTFTNQILPPVLTITKTNDKTGIDVSAGASVLYTLTVSLAGSPLFNVSLVDLPPAGFKYRSGSFTAVSNLNPGLIISEPVYASPGTWNLGNMAAGEIITLTYIADIDAATDPGVYKDLAWAKGKSLALADILANKSSSPEFFVGTEVNVVKNIGESTGVEVERKERGEVLGISTSLPATGVNTIWVVLAALLIAGGAGLMWQGMNLRRKYE